MGADLGLRTLWLAALPLLTGCYASNVVAIGERAVGERVMPSTWRPATAAELVGEFTSIAIRGDAAIALRRVHYVFLAGGRYTGAGLVEGDQGLEFQTLSGSWRIADGSLVLDDGEPVPCEIGDDLLRIRAATGELVLAREAAR